MTQIRRLAPGVCAALAVGILATWLGGFAPLIGGPIIALLIGMLLTSLRGTPAGERMLAGAGFTGKRVLQLAIVVLGGTMSLAGIAELGARTAPVLFGTLAIALTSGWLLAKLVRISRDESVLLTVGTSICGASAIAATAPILAAEASVIALAVTAIFTYNLVAVFVFPWLGHLLGMSQEAFGLFAGTAVNDTSSVVAAASIYGAEAAQIAVVVKLTRTLAIIPITIALSWWIARTSKTAATASGEVATKRKRPWQLVPWFLTGFLVAALAASLGAIPAAWSDGLHLIAKTLIAAALAGIGFTVDFAVIRKAGFKPLGFAGVLWVIITLSTLGLMWATGWL